MILKHIDSLIIRLAVPVFFSMLSATLIQVSDTLMVGRLGKEAIASTGLGGLAYFTVIAFLMAGSIGVQILTARRLGEKDREAIGKIGTNSVYTAIVLGAFMTITGYYLSDECILLVNDHVAIQDTASSYLRYRFLGTIPLFGQFILRGFFDGLGFTQIGMFAAFTTTFTNILLNWILIFGHLGAPAMGVDGAALASSLSVIPGLLLFIGFLFKQNIKQYFSKSSFAVDWHILKSTLTIGFPTALDGALTNIGFLSFNKLAGFIGVHSIASTQILITIAALSFMPGFSFGVAATTILGQSMGAGKIKLAKAGTARSAHFSAIFMGTLGVIFIVAGEFLISLFTTDTLVIKETYPALVVMALVQPGDAYHMVFGSALRSAGLVWWVLKIYFVATYFLMLPVAYLFGIHLSFGTTGLWFGLAFWLLILSIIFSWRFKKADWITEKI